MKRASRLAIVALLLAVFCLQTFVATAALPQKPNFANVSAVSPFEIDLNWRDRANDEDGFQIERSTDGRTNFRQIAQVLPGTTTYRDKNLFPGAKYFYRIHAFNASGASRYDTTSARTQTPVVPLSIADWGPLGVLSPTNSDLVSVSAGAFHGLGLKKDGTVIAWGYDDSGDTVVPTNLNSVIAISAGDGFSLALKNDGTVVEWGADGTGEINRTNSLTNVTAISAGLRHSLALKSDGTVVAWGFDDSGDTIVPDGLTGVVEIAAGQAHSLALKSDGTVVGWGGGFSGAGIPPTNLTSVVAIAAGPGLSVAVKSDGTLAAWGSYGFQTTTATSNLTDAVAVALGGGQAVALRKNGSLFNWSFTSPTAIVPDLSNSVVAISANFNHFAALSTAPAAPSNPFLTVLSANQVRLSWQDNSPDEKSFAIERSGYSDPNILPWVQIATVNANVTNFTDTTVQIGSTYTYRVRAIGKFGNSPAPYEAILTLAPPAAPESLSATIGSTNQINLTWYGSFNEINSFKIERAPDNNGAPGDWTEIASIPTSSFPQNFTDSTAQANTTYWYRVRAFNFFGISDYSDPVSLNVVPPPTPQFLEATTFADSITLYWSYNPANQGFKIERASDVNGAPGAWTQIALLNASSGTQYTDRGLSLNTTYWYRVRAFNWVGDSAYVGPTNVTIVPPAPPNLANITIGLINGVDITWYPVINDEDGFKLERAPDVGGAPGAWSEIASFNDTNASSASFHDTNIVANHTYWYRVRAFNLFGLSDYSTPVSISLLPPPAPIFFTATSYANTVDLQWQTTTPNLLAFKIERAPDADGVPGAWTQIAALTNVPGTYSSYTDTNLTGGATYWYRIRSSTWIGDSPYSGLAVVTIDPPATPEIYFIALDTTKGVNLGLRQNNADEDGFLLERAVPTDLGFMNWTQIATVNSLRATTVNFTDTNAIPNATNYYRARAFNSVGVSDYSAATSVPVTPPAPPYLDTSGRADNIFLGIYPNDPTIEAVLGYRLQRAPDAGGHPGAWTQIAVLDASGSHADYTDTGLAVGPIYWYRAQAFNWVGDSDFGEFYGVTLSLPLAPSIVSAWLSVTNHQADLSWYDQAPDEDGFTIERAPDTNGNPGLWSQIGTLYATNSFASEFSDTNVIANTTNWYRVRAFNTVSVSDYSNPISLAATAPAPPTLLGDVSVNTANLSWYDATASANSIAGYKLERAPNLSGAPGPWTQLTNTPDSQYTDKNLAADTTYWYRLRSYNWVGTSEYSDPMSLTTMPPERPSNLSVALGTNTNTVVLQWVDFYQDHDGFKIERAADAGGYPGDAWEEIGTVNTPYFYQLSFVDTNVTANTTNWYRVRAFGPTGFSDYDGDASVFIVPPDAPSGMTAWSYQNTVQVSWGGPTFIGFSGSVLERAPDAGGVPGTWTDIATNTQSVTYYTDSGLPSGTYWYRVRAFNWVGSSDFSSSVSATILQVAAPAKPDAPSVYVTETKNQVSMYWYDDASDEDGFKIQHALDIDGAPGSWTEIGTVYATNASYAEFNDTNVVANSTNWYRVQAFNSVGFSEFSDSNSVVVTAPDIAPTITGAEVIAAHRIDLQWRGDFDFIQGFKIERAPDNGGLPGTWTLLADQPAPDTDGSYSDITVVMNKQYWYRVQSYNWSGSSPYSDPLLVNDAPPPAPSLLVTNNLPNQFTVNWAITNTDITTVKIERAPDNSGTPGTWIQIAEPPAYCGLIPTNYTDIGIPAGQTFWYRVRAVNAVGDSPYSNDTGAIEKLANTSSSTPTPAQILSLTTTNDGVLIQWSTTGGNSPIGVISIPR